MGSITSFLSNAFFARWPAPAKAVAPADDNAAVAPAPRPPAPAAWRTGTALPAATPPPLAMATELIHDAARDLAAIPADVNPAAPSKAGTAIGAAMAPAKASPAGRAQPLQLLPGVLLQIQK